MLPYFLFFLFLSSPFLIGLSNFHLCLRTDKHYDAVLVGSELEVGQNTQICASNPVTLNHQTTGPY